MGQFPEPGGSGPTVCRPEVWVPDNVVTLAETLETCERLHAGHPRLGTVLRMIANTGVRKRHLVQPLAESLVHPGVGERMRVYHREAQRQLPAVVDGALQNAGLGPADVDAIVVVSCTGFTMPPLSTWMINELGFRRDTCQLPIAQLGCAAGGAAINRAHDHCLAHPDANVLVVACEFCSLCYQPGDTDVGALLSAGLFGDAIAAAVVRGAGGDGVRLTANASYVVPGTEDWISYDVDGAGFHFRLDRRVPGTMSMVAPALREMSEDRGWDPAELDFYAIHAGGPRILTDLSAHLGVPEHRFRHSRDALECYGNIASATVFAALRNVFDDGIAHGGRGMIAGFGPGITAEASLGVWTAAQPAADERAPAELVAGPRS